MNCETLFHTFITIGLIGAALADWDMAREFRQARPRTATAGAARAAPRLQPGAGAHGSGVAGVHASQVAGGGASNGLD